MVYEDLRRIARQRVSFGLADVSPEPSSLVNELYLRLAGSHDLSFSNRTQFFGLAAQMLRRILVDGARARGSSKRGGDAEKIAFEEADFASPERDREMAALDDALEALAKVDPRKARAVELRFFGGLTMEETAETMGISVQTVRRDWQVAQAWLSREARRKNGGETASL
jgi:RNA polymerase sigma factor (TIGR02999 family)